MTQALRVISIQQGHDPADFALVSFGGAGGLHVCALADNLSMARAIVPERAGVLSAEGLVFAPRKRERLCALPVDVSLDALLQLVADLKQQGQAALVAEGVDAQDVQYRVMLDMCYRGQSSVVSVPWQEGQPLADSTAAFHQRHEQRFGHRLALPVQHVNVRVACHVDGQQLTLPTRHPEPCDPERWVTLPNITSPVAVYRRDTLGANQRLVGPALIYEAVGTVWLAQGWYATVHPQGHLLLDKGEQ